MTSRKDPLFLLSAKKLNYDPVRKTSHRNLLRYSSFASSQSLQEFYLNLTIFHLDETDVLLSYIEGAYEENSNSAVKILKVLRSIGLFYQGNANMAKYVEAIYQKLLSIPHFKVLLYENGLLPDGIEEEVPNNALEGQLVNDGRKKQGRVRLILLMNQINLSQAN